MSINKTNYLFLNASMFWFYHLGYSKTHIGIYVVTLKSLQQGTEISTLHWYYLQY